MFSRSIGTFRLSIAVLLMLFVAPIALGQSTAFTYQGKLSENNLAPNANYDFEFKLFNALAAGSQVGGTIQRLNVPVSSGIFNVSLDFGAGVFPGADRFLEISVKLAGIGSFTLLSPRQPITAIPYALRSASALNADNAINAQSALNATDATTAQNALQLGGVAANQFVKTNDSRLSDDRAPTPGSINYIQNTISPQSSSNFNISGSGTLGGTLTANVVSAATQYNIGSARVLTSPGSFNFFAGNGAGQLNTTGSSNAFFGVNAGIFNTTGGSNSFFGFEAGRNSNSGSRNSFFGKDAGRSITTGNDNSFFGNDAGQLNTAGSSNSFFGKGSGANNTADGNSFFGFEAGEATTTGANNSFFGFQAGNLNDDAFNNSFFGHQAGQNNVIGLNNCYFGFIAGQLATGSRNCFFGSGAGQVTTGGFHNSFFGGQAGGANTTGDDNSFVGLDAGLANTTGSFNTVVGSASDLGAGNLTNATAIGAKAFVTTSNSLVLGQINGVNGATADTNVGIGTTSPVEALHVDGRIRVTTLGSAGATSLCRNASNQISTCSSSRRYKTNITPFLSGLELIDRLHPVAFEWKHGGERDLGLVAEDVEQVEPLLVTYTALGVEGVKYDRVAVVLLNAVKEQQELIKMQQLQLKNQQRVLERQQAELNSLRVAICRRNSRASRCK